MTRFNLELPYVVCITKKDMYKIFHDVNAFEGFCNRCKTKAMLHGKTDISKISIALIGGNQNENSRCN